MAKTWTDNIWVVWFSIQLPIVLFVDGSWIYPDWFLAPGMPLHFVQMLREWYIREYNDPMIQWSMENAKPHEGWIPLVLYLEWLFLFPTAVYAVWRMAVSSRRSQPLSGAEELWFMVYAFEMAFTTLMCIVDISFWDPAVYSPEIKDVFRYQFFGPFLVIPSLMFTDYCLRVLRRLDAAEKAKKTQ